MANRKMHYVTRQRGKVAAHYLEICYFNLTFLQQWNVVPLHILRYLIDMSWPEARTSVVCPSVSAVWKTPDKAKEIQRYLQSIRQYFQKRLLSTLTFPSDS